MCRETTIAEMEYAAADSLCAVVDDENRAPHLLFDDPPFAAEPVDQLELLAAR